MKKQNLWMKGYVISFSHYSLLKRRIPLFLLLVLFSMAGSAQTSVAELPFELKINGNQSFKNVNGLKCASSLDFFYAGDGSVRFSNNSDYMIIRFDSPAKTLSIKKTTGGKGSVFHISGSPDGNEYELIEDLTILATTTHTLSTSRPISPTFRYLKIGYTKESNVGISLVQIEAQETEATLVKPPSFSLEEGNYLGTQFVTINMEETHIVYYTLDGTAPTLNSILYTGEPIEVSSSLTLQAVAYNPKNKASNPTIATYTILTENNGPLIYRTLFYESFDQNPHSGGNDDKWSGSIASPVIPQTDQEGWTFQNSFSASECIVLGTSSQQKGTATTPVLGVAGNGRLRFNAGSWNTTSEITTCTVRISNSNGRLDHPSVSKPGQSITITLEKGKFNTYEIEITGAVESSSRISFSAEPTGSRNARFFLDEVTVFTLMDPEILDSPISALSGKWDPESVSEFPDLYSVNSETALKLNEELIFMDDFLVDNLSGNPNLIVYSSYPVSVINGLNAVKGFLTERTEIKDRASFQALENLTGEVFFKRAFNGSEEGSGGWHALSLPFTVTRVIGNNAEYIPYVEWIKNQPRDKGFFWLKTTDPEGLTNHINTDASHIEANIPYIIAFPNYNYPDYPLLNIQDSLEFTFYGEEIRSTEELSPSMMKDWWFQPNFCALQTENCYVLNLKGDLFERGSKDFVVSTEPFRPYLIYKGDTNLATPISFSIENNDFSSGIKDMRIPSTDYIISVISGGILLKSSIPQEVSIYDSLGQLVKHLTLSSGENKVNLLPGCYIVNKQKVAIY